MSSSVPSNSSNLSSRETAQSLSNNGSAPNSKDTAKQGDSYTEYSLRSCTKLEIEGVRHHVIKFQSRNKVDPVTQFDHPVRLHRKDPRNLQFQLTRREIEERKIEREAKIKKLQERQLQRRLQRQEADTDTMDLDEDIAEGDSDLDEVLKQLRAEEERKNKKNLKPTTDLTVVAPDGDARTHKRNLFKKKTRQVNVVDESKRRLRYEEYYPWVMEDHDGKNTWVGSYEAGSTDSYVVFVFDKDGFKMIPLEKVYKFTPRNKYATLTLEEAESRMQKNSQVPRWLMKHMADENREAGVLDPRFRKNNNKLKTVTGANNEGGRGSDNEDIDYDEAFDDDEEAPIIEDEELNRDSERRMKREMLSANALGIEKSYDDEDEEDDEEFADLFGSKKLEDKDIKKLRKTLVKSEMNDAYDTDEEENPYLSKSEDEDENDENSDTKVKKEDEESKVKKENIDQQIPKLKRSQSPSLARQIYITSTKHLFINIKAPSKTLEAFPRGVWNVNVVKRKFDEDDDEEDDQSLAKRLKIEPTEPTLAAAKPPPTMDDLLTEEDIRKVVSNGPVKIAELSNALRKKIHRHPENKNRVKQLVKKCLRQQNGLLYLKEPNPSN